MKSVILFCLLGLLTINFVSCGIFDGIFGTCRPDTIEKIRDRFYIAKKNLYQETLLNRAASKICEFQKDIKCNEAARTKESIKRALQEMKNSKQEFVDRLRYCGIAPILGKEMRTPSGINQPVPCYWDSAVVQTEPVAINLNSTMKIQQENYDNARKSCKSENNCPALQTPKNNLIIARENYEAYDLLLRSLKERSTACRTPIQRQGQNQKMITHQITHIIHRSHPDIINLFPGVVYVPTVPFVPLPVFVPVPHFYPQPSISVTHIHHSSPAFSASRPGTPMSQAEKQAARRLRKTNKKLARDEKRYKKLQNKLNEAQNKNKKKKMSKKQRKEVKRLRRKAKRLEKKLQRRENPRREEPMKKKKKQNKKKQTKKPKRVKKNPRPQRKPKKARGWYKPKARSFGRKPKKSGGFFFGGGNRPRRRSGGFRYRAPRRSGGFRRASFGGFGRRR